MAEKREHIDHGVAIRSLERSLGSLATSLYWIEVGSEEYRRIRRAQFELYASITIIQNKIEKSS